MFTFIRERILIDKLMGNSEAGILFWRFHFSCIAKKNRDNNSNNYNNNNNNNNNNSNNNNSQMPERGRVRFPPPPEPSEYFGEFGVDPRISAVLQ
jgi:hypothetical protein